MATITKLDNDEVGFGIDETKYSGMIGSLLYLIASRLDIFRILIQIQGILSQGY